MKTDLLSAQDLAERFSGRVSYQRLLRGIRTMNQEGLLQIERGPNNDVRIPADKLLLVDRLVGLMERDYGARKAAEFLREQLDDIERIKILTDEVEMLKSKYEALRKIRREPGCFAGEDSAELVEQAAG